MDYSEQDATLICALLLRQGYIKRRDFVRLELDEHLMREVQDRLAQVGMALVFNSYSPFYAVRLIQQAQDTLEQSNNLGLKNNEVAMLVLLWSKLILPKRMALESPNLPQPTDNLSLDANQNLASGQDLPLANSEGTEESPSSWDEFDGQKNNQKKLEEMIGQEQEISVDPVVLDGDDPEQKMFVRVPELYAEYGRHFGSKTAFKSTLTRISNLQFIRVHNEVITEGIFLDLLIDGHQMGNEIKRSALAYKLAGLGDEEEWADEALEEDEDTEELPENDEQQPADENSGESDPEN